MRLANIAAAILLLGGATASAAEVNVYTGRHYEADAKLYVEFETASGIKVNVIEGKTDELLARLEAEGDASPADVFVTADAGNLYRAAQKGLLQPVRSDILTAKIPAAYRDPDSRWFGFSRRARVIMIDKSAIDPALVQTYQDLIRPELKGKLCMRSGSAAYNLSLTGGFIEAWGAERAEAWAKGIVANLARPPAGGDTDQIKAVAAGECAATLANTYYLVRMVKSENPDDRAVAAKIQAIFPDQQTTGAHVNISGAGIAKYAPNRDAAVRLLEFLSEGEAQMYFASGNNEYPVGGGPTSNAELDALGAFKADDVNVSVYGKNQAQAQAIMDRVGWK